MFIAANARQPASMTWQHILKWCIFLEKIAKCMEAGLSQILYIYIFMATEFLNERFLARLLIESSIEPCSYGTTSD